MGPSGTISLEWEHTSAWDLWLPLLVTVSSPHSHSPALHYQPNSTFSDFSFRPYLPCTVSPDARNNCHSSFSWRRCLHIYGALFCPPRPCFSASADYVPLTSLYGPNYGAPFITFITFLLIQVTLCSVSSAQTFKCVPQLAWSGGAVYHPCLGGPLAPFSRCSGMSPSAWAPCF